MTSVSYDWDKSRDRLARLIMDVIRAWPERDRRIFIAARYRGQSLEQISQAQGMKVSEVRCVVEECERRLFGALKRSWRGGEALGPPDLPGNRLQYALKDLTRR
jgi:DNA-directed RNA polymerase specialized sigma24 family protein